MTRFLRVLFASGLLGLTLGLATGCSNGAGDANSAENGSGGAGPGERPHNVRVLDLERTDLEEFLQLTGPLRAVKATDVSTEEAGVVERFPHEKGSLVRKGQVIVQLDRRVLEAEMKSAEAAVTLREYNNERTRSLLDANSVSKQEMLVVHTELEQAREAARIARLRWERAAISAPFDGIVAQHYVEIGQLVSPGQVVARVVDPFHLELEGSVTEREVLWAEVGSPALVSVDGIDAVVPATVSWVSVEADPVSGKFPVELRVDNPDLRLRAGVVGRARVLKRVHENAVVIPRDAVVQHDGQRRVYVVDGDRVQPREVALGADQGMMVVVTDGLNGDERIVVRGQRQLNPDGRIAVEEVATARDGSMPGDPPAVREDVGAAEFRGAIRRLDAAGGGR